METTAEQNIINVTLIEPKLKHPTIFKVFDELAEGESLTIHNDHDPRPVYYQMLGERGNVFTWEYLEEGPEWWKVTIRKRIAGENEATMGELAAKDLRKVEVFKKYGLDFSCDGKKTVKEVCAEKGLDVTRIEQELQQTDKTPTSPSVQYDEWGLDFLADYIVNTHHRLIRKTLPEIVTYAQKVMEVHSGRYPELVAINDAVKDLNLRLNAETEQEEKLIFPKIKALVNMPENSRKVESLKGSIDAITAEHQLVIKAFNEIKKLSNNYTLPQDACASYTVLYRMLAELETDTQLHVHLENNILFPKHLDLEK